MWLNRGDTMIRAYYETRNFTFDTYGSTENEAKQLMIKLWKQHCRNYRVSYSEFPKDYDDIDYTDIKIGSMFVDNQKVN